MILTKRAQTCRLICMMEEESNSPVVSDDEDLPGSQESLGLSQGTVNELMKAITSNGYS